MNWIDKTIGYISPEAGYKREAYRKALDEIRNYDAAGYDRVNANWRVFNESAEMTDRYGRDNIRARARDLERNSDIMNAVVGAFKRNVYGAGYRLRANSGNEEMDHEIEKMWKVWCKKKNCDVTGQQSFSAIMRMSVQRKKIDGGIILLKRYTTGGFLPFKIQTLEVDELDLTATATKETGNKVVGGIEYNSYNRPVGYYISQYSVDGTTINQPVYIEAKDVIFYFTKSRPSQIREMSDMTPTITRIRDVNEFMRAVSVKERILACFSVFIERMLPTSGTTLGRGVGTGLSGSATENDAKYDGKTLTPGMIHYLNQGDKAQAVVPTGQATDATAYVKQEVRLIGSGQGLSYETMSRDMSESNYSSARQGMIEDDLTYEEEKDLLMEVMDEIYETFLISLVLAKKVTIKDFWENKDIYMDHTWIKAPKRWIDPVKEANSNKIALNTGQKTWADLAAENGKDWKEQLEEMAEIIEYGNQKGIDMGGIIYGSGTKQSTNQITAAKETK